MTFTGFARGVTLGEEFAVLSADSTFAEVEVRKGGGEVLPVGALNSLWPASGVGHEGYSGRARRRREEGGGGDGVVFVAGVAVWDFAGAFGFWGDGDVVGGDFGGGGAGCGGEFAGAGVSVAGGVERAWGELDFEAGG